MLNYRQVITKTIFYRVWGLAFIHLEIKYGAQYEYLHEHNISFGAHMICNKDSRLHFIICTWLYSVHAL